MTTKPDKFMRSQRMEQKAKNLNRHPAQHIVELINLYHSLDKIYFPTKQDAESVRVEIKNKILEESTSVPRILQFKIETALKSKRAWEDLRNHIF